VQIRSLGLATDVGLAATRGTLVDRGDCLVVETPDDPGYYYGNLLVLPEPPLADSIDRWQARFHHELPNPEIRHVTLAWDGIAGDAGPVDELEAAGFTMDHSVVMSAAAVIAHPVMLPIRCLEPHELTVDLAWAVADRHDESYRRFLQRRVAWHRDLIARGIARWYGAFDGAHLVASLGLVDLVASSGPWSGPLAHHARYQDVETAVAYRKRGLASALLAAAANDAFSRGIATVVIVAEPGGDAARVYTRVGFTAIEHVVSACLRPVTEPARHTSRPWRAMTES